MPDPADDLRIRDTTVSCDDVANCIVTEHPVEDPVELKRFAVGLLCVDAQQRRW